MLDRERWTFKKQDLAPILLNPRTEVQDHLHFTYEDLYFYVPVPSHIRCLIGLRTSWSDACSSCCSG